MANPRMKHAKLFNTQVQMVFGTLYNMSVHAQIIMSKTSKIDDLNVFIRVPLFFQLQYNSALYKEQYSNIRYITLLAYS